MVVGYFILLAPVTKARQDVRPCNTVLLEWAFQLRGEKPMTFDEIQAEISILLNDFDERPEDARELYVQLHEKIRELRAFGMPVPKDLIKFEKNLLAEFQAESQGR